MNRSFHGNTEARDHHRAVLREIRRIEREQSLCPAQYVFQTLSTRPTPTSRAGRVSSGALIHVEHSKRPSDWGPGAAGDRGS